MMCVGCQKLRMSSGSPLAIAVQRAGPLRSGSTDALVMAASLPTPTFLNGATGSTPLNVQSPQLQQQQQQQFGSVYGSSPFLHAARMSTFPTPPPPLFCASASNEVQMQLAAGGEEPPLALGVLAASSGSAPAQQHPFASAHAHSHAHSLLMAGQDASEDVARLSIQVPNAHALSLSHTPLELTLAAALAPFASLSSLLECSLRVLFGDALVSSPSRRFVLASRFSLPRWLSRSLILVVEVYKYK